ncbi:uncharacterized protein LOC111014775 [Momordica charantia]|uniref:Uncharacterized protein LOC111014775 n=1 Tax=Momordica charantia TaxID=3673 RepID=A0A6J1CW60_MOMCH|nr:uncharacterized protein LOC111014775 [Momordica charantia]
MASKAIMWLMIVLLLHLNCKGSLAFDSNLSMEEELEFEMQLKLLNKPSITTFQTEEGDIIDCVDINKQPALDHPLLKNHKVQVASVAMKRGKKYYGDARSVSVYNLSVAQDQSSSSNIWIIGGPPEAPNVILTGWQVNPMINGDSRTRMFVYWTADGGIHTGYYNMFCRCFIQTNPSTPPNIPLYPSSTYQGKQYDYTFTVFQDRPTGDWWLAVSDSQTTIGYWPKELFGHLNDGAEQVAWGGIAKPSPNGMSPPLGNGHKPNYGKHDDACYFRTLNYINENNESEVSAIENTASYIFVLPSSPVVSTCIRLRLTSPATFISGRLRFSPSSQQFVSVYPD